MNSQFWNQVLFVQAGAIFFSVSKAQQQTFPKEENSEADIEKHNASCDYLLLYLNIKQYLLERFLLPEQ